MYKCLLDKIIFSEWKIYKYTYDFIGILKQGFSTNL